MKLIVALLCAFLALPAFAGNVLTNPANNTDNSVTPTTSSVKALTLNGAAGAIALDVEGNAASSNPAINVNANDYDAADLYTQSGWGAFIGSTAGYGLYATSYQESSAVFQSGTSADTKPTVLIQGMTGSADLLEFQDINGVKLSSVSQDGVYHASKGLDSVVASLPTCASSNEGLIAVQKASGGNATKLELCSNNGSGTYSWVAK